jgi:CHAT domain-containing protein
MKKPFLLNLVLSACLLFHAHTVAAQLRMALLDFPPCPDSSRIADCIVSFGRCGDAGQLDSAIYYARKLDTICLRQYGELSHSYAIVLGFYLTMPYLATDDRLTAYSNLRQSLTVFEKIGDTTGSKYGDACFRFGVLSYDFMAFSDAEKYLSRVIPFYEPGSPMWHFVGAHPDTYAQTLLLLASSYFNLGDYEKAVALNTTLNSVVDTMRNDDFMNYMRGALYNNMGLLYAQTGNPLKAASYLEKALPVEAVASFAGTIKSDYVEILINLADVYLACGKVDSARSKCREAADSLKEMPASFLHMKLLGEKAGICQYMGRLPGAIELYKEYCRTVDTMASKPDEHETIVVRLGDLYCATKQYASADSLFKVEIHRLRASGLLYSYALQQASTGLCESLIAQHRLDEAADSLVGLIHLSLQTMQRNFAGLSENDQLRYKSGLAGIFDLLYTCLYENKNNRQDLLSAAARLEIARGSLVLSSRAQFLLKARNSPDTTIAGLYQTWLNGRQLLAGQYALPYAQRTFRIDSLEEECERLEQQLSVLGYEAGIVAITEAVHPLVKLPPGSADISFIRFHLRSASQREAGIRYAAFVYTANDSLPAFVRLCSEATLSHLLKIEDGQADDEDQLTQKLYNRNSPYAPALYRLIWLPLEPALRGIHHIHYSTAGLLNNIAFTALYTGKAYLADHYALHRHLNLREAAADAAATPMPASIQRWGNMDYEGTAAPQSRPSADSDHAPISPSYLNASNVTKGAFRGALPNLPGGEMQELRKTFGGTLVHDVEFEAGFATEENFKRQAAGMSGVLHISTHGFYAPYEKAKEKRADPGSFMAGIANPLFRCGLAFSGVNHYWTTGKTRANQDDGILTGYEISQLDLHRVDLVVLSACETGLGDVTDDEGNLGLQRAFRLAGVRRMLISLWKVPARQTGELLSGFYSAWLRTGSINEALRTAQQALQQKGYPPYYWAGFVLIE